METGFVSVPLGHSTALRDFVPLVPVSPRGVSEGLVDHVSADSRRSALGPTRRDDHRPGQRLRRHTSPEDLRRGHDATYRLLHQHRELFRELLVEHCDGWIDVDRLDFARVERLPESHVSERGERRIGDLAWRVGYPCEGRHLVVVIEFQSSPDTGMARRMHEYGVLTALGLDRADKLDEGELQPHGLAVVVYSGSRPWRPKGSLGMEGRPGEAAVTCARQSRWSPFHFVDIRELGRRESQRETLLEWLGRAEADGGPEGMRRLRKRVLERYPGTSHEKLRQHVQLWMGQLAVGLDVDPVLVENTWRLEEGEVLIATAEEKLRKVRAEGRVEGRVEGRQEGRVEGRQEGRVEGRVEGRQEGRVEGRAALRAEIANVIRNGGTAAEALARVEEIVNGNGESSGS